MLHAQLSFLVLPALLSNLMLHDVLSNLLLHAVLSNLLLHAVLSNLLLHVLLSVLVRDAGMPMPQRHQPRCLFKSPNIYCTCAADAVIWAEQQLVAIPGWLLKDQNARLDQEGQFTSLKEPRSPVTKKNKAKRRTFYWEDGNSSHPLPPPVATLGPGLASLQKKPADLWRKVEDLRKRWRILEKSDGFEANTQVASFGETMEDFH